MKILLLNPPSFDSLYINRDLMGGLGVNNAVKEGLSERVMSFFKARSIRLPVMSLVYAATVLKKDFDVTVIDAANLELSEAETIKQIEQQRPDMVISTTSISTLMKEAQLLETLKKQLNVTTALAGDAATDLAAEIMDQHPVDFIIKGDEPEFILKHLAQVESYKDLKGVVYRENGELRDTGEPETIMDLDTLPFPAWDLFPINSYRYFPILRRTPFLTVLSTRGCPYGCIYCPYTSNQGLKYRFRSAENVIDELRLLKEKYNVRAVQFRDPTFTIRKDRTHQICDGMIEHKLNLEWGCETRVDCLSEELIDKMVAAGLKGVNIGVESTDPDVIRNAKRGWIDPQRIEKTVRYMADNGIRVSGFFILGLPGESPRTVEETLKFAARLPLSYAEFKIATPFPGTPLYEMAKQNKWIDELPHLEQYTSYTPSMRISEELNPDYLKEASNRAYKAFYSKPKRIINEISSPSFIFNLVSLMRH
jgi:radical SAM superfamily enzyme YgiQ (UPF0313 family)